MGWPLKRNDVGQDVGSESLAARACLSLKVAYAVLIEEFVSAITVDMGLPIVSMRL